MGTDLVVVHSPVLNDNSGLDAVSEPLHGQTLVPKLAVKALVHSVLPGLSGIDEGCLNLLIERPFQERGTHKFGAVIGPQVTRCAAQAHQTAQDLDNPLGSYRSRDVDRQAFPAPRTEWS